MQTPFPGVLGGWREDIQGALRRDSLTLDRDVFVTTNFGQVQGFKVKTKKKKLFIKYNL